MFSFSSVGQEAPEIRARITTNNEIGDVSTLTIFSGEAVITIHFELPEDLINFCKTHNIPLEDKRNAKQ